MPRKNPLPEFEATICRRLLEFREASGLSRVDFAQRAGIDSTTLSNLEHLRSPLGYWNGKKICNNLGLNPDWLVREAISRGSPIWTGQLEGPFEATASDSDLFSNVYLSNFPDPAEDAYQLRHAAFVEEVKDWLGTMGIRSDLKKMSLDEYRDAQRRMTERPGMQAILAHRDRAIIQLAFGRTPPPFEPRKSR